MARPSSAVVLWAVLAAGTSSLHAAPRPFSVGPPPPWVEHLAVDTKQATPTDQVSAGVYYLLADHQVRVATSVEAYHHIARRIVNDAGVGNGSELNIHFDPAFQGMRIHFLRIRRGPQLLERLVPAKIQVIQREPELESRIYDGSLSAIAFIEDVRVGDVIEYAYTVTGTNPVFAGRYADSFGVDWSVPLHRMRFRLLWPAGRALYIRNHRTSMAPDTREGSSARELVWDVTDPDAVADAPNLPRGYDPWGWVQLGEHETWADVARWGTALFAVPERAPVEVEDLLAAWRKASADPAVRVLTALRFVQDEVRYLGMEMGASSHRPAPPDVVLQRRFGDCKDKALLFCTLARALGARAQPALVRSPSGKALDEWNPSPLAFNHVVARIEVEGRTYWVDPTLSAQGGDLAHTSFPDYERALVLAPESASLTRLPAPDLATPTTSTREVIAAKSFDGLTEYRVETRFEAGDADRTRRDLQESSRDEIGKSYLKFYARTYAKIRAAAPVEFKDDRARNVLTSVERYVIPGFWSADHKVQLRPSLVETALPEPRSTHGMLPVGLTHPIHVSHETEILLPEDWDLPSESVSVGDKAARLNFSSRYADQKLTLRYVYRTLAGAVSAPDVEAHFAKMADIRDRLPYSLQRPLVNVPASAKGRINPIVAAMVGCFLPLCLLMASRVIAHRAPAPAGFEAPDPALAGIRGWLLLLALFVVAAPAYQAAKLLGSWSHMTNEGWAQLTTVGAPGYHPFGDALFIIDLLGRVGLLLGFLVVLLLFVLRRRGFPGAYTALAVLAAGVFFVVQILSRLSRGSPSAIDAVLDASLFLVPACAWIAYLRLSDRAQSTFVR